MTTQRDGVFPLPEGWTPAPAQVLDTALTRTLAAFGPAGTRSKDALERLRAYYDPAGHYAGALMTTLAPNPENDICPADLFAVSMLSIDVPPLVSRRLLDRGEPRRIVQRRLREIPYGLSLSGLASDEPAVRRAREAMWDLHNELRTVLAEEGASSNRWVFAAKLCARKRPWLFPVRDNLVCEYLSEPGHLRRKEGPGHFDIDMQVFAHLMAQTEVRDQLTGLRAELEREGLALDDTDLRLLDVVLWTCARELIA